MLWRRADYSASYACAVGWERGWGTWSVGGRCLCWAVGMESVGAGIGMDDSGYVQSDP